MDKRKKKTASLMVVAAANPVKLAHYAALFKLHPGNDANTQRIRLSLALQHAPITTYEARKYLDIYHPNARALELRAQGIRIDTLRVAQQTDAGVIHRRIGLYVLQSGEVSHE